jgi:hypothetical protein
LCRHIFIDEMISRAARNGRRIPFDTTEQQTSDKRADDRPRHHHQEEQPIFAQNGETLIAAVTREADQHRGEAHRQRKTSREFDIPAEQQHQRRNEKFASGHTSKEAATPITKPATIPATTCDPASLGD